MAQTRQPGGGEWKHGLFECQCPDCALAYFFLPCYAYCVAKSAGKEGCGACIHCVFPILLCCLRAEVRKQHGIEGGCCQDLLCTYFCGCCTAVQMKRQNEA